MVQYEILEDKKKNIFSLEEVEKYHNDGYRVEDLNKAQVYSLRSGVDKEVILKERGKYPKIKSWKKVIKRLKLKVVNPGKKTKKR